MKITILLIPLQNSRTTNTIIQKIFDFFFDPQFPILQFQPNPSVPRRLLFEGDGDILRVFPVHRNPIHSSWSSGIGLGTRKSPDLCHDPNFPNRVGITCDVELGRSHRSKCIQFGTEFTERERESEKRERERERRSRVCVLEKKKKERNPEEA